MTKDDLVKTVSGNVGASQGEVQRVVEEAIAAITEAVSAGETVDLHPLGRWLPVQEPEHAGTDPKSHQPITIPARVRVLFHPSQALKDAANTAAPTAG